MPTCPIKQSSYRSEICFNGRLAAKRHKVHFIPAHIYIWLKKSTNNAQVSVQQEKKH